MRYPSYWWRVAGAALATLQLAGCEPKEEAAKPVLYQGPLIETTNVETLVSDSARLQLRLTAPLEQQYENGDMLYRKSVHVQVFDKPGKVVVNTMNAKFGKLDKNKQLYTMRGDVQVANVPQQQTLKTEELFYDKLKHKIYTDTAMAVRVQTPTEVLTGRGLEANEDFSRYRILRPVGTFTLAQAKSQGI
ncbi:MAG: LPS export ABC transporter periplasmic protein LptC [Cytophagaceae bacterium]|nr:MAG: LPS export ABC transporter periplasmic protein LptC [Cytophagaceae bacterium]